MLRAHPAAYYFAAVSIGRDEVETYAHILAELARGADRASTLERYGLDEPAKRGSSQPGSWGRARRRG